MSKEGDMEIIHENGEPIIDKTNNGQALLVSLATKEEHMESIDHRGCVSCADLQSITTRLD